MRKNPDNYFGGSCTVSKFKNEIMDAIWGVLGVELKNSLSSPDNPFGLEKYFQINRQLSDTIDRFVGKLGASYTIDARNLQPGIEEYIHDKLTHMIADELMKSDFVAVQELGGDYACEKYFHVEVPFLKLTTKKGV